MNSCGSTKKKELLSKKTGSFFLPMVRHREHVIDLILLKELIEAGEIKPVVDRACPLEQIVEAHGIVNRGTAREILS
jgi:NADPH:quinone reductase-like Zn-dependent oxidoreductase